MKEITVRFRDTEIDGSEMLEDAPGLLFGMITQYVNFRWYRRISSKLTASLRPRTRACTR
ncbi:hypothetical protein [Evansella halocellulosilytica]|uniref:hypothetical protein n=1 Tax=Evansella halocellulosilytica TaxID=2011013 RepID=UPI0015C7E281|nr:hypothetical protein [Evansella halocellulosilytica]